MTTALRIGCWSGAWGDSLHATADLLRAADLDVIVGDYLAEVTMALLARARAKDAAGGHVPDVVTALAPVMREIADRGLRVVTNAGGLNPTACREALQSAAAASGVTLPIAVVEGDDLLARFDELRGRHLRGMTSRDEIPATPLTLNAYLGARPIAAALDAGAQIVLTGRAADTALVLGPLMSAFGWADDDYDLLSAGSLAGHILECGAQGVGGLFSDWEAVPGWDNMAPPIAECGPDGSIVITKAPGMGGLVTPATVAEQIVYEIGDPGAYVLPDVVCDWRDVRLDGAGPERVRVAGARGSAPTTTYKVTSTYEAGHRVLATAMYAGHSAGAKARRAGHAILARVDRLLAERGEACLSETSVEIIGTEDTYGPAVRRDDAREVVLKLAARDPRADALQLLAREFAPAALSMAPGMSGLTGGRPRVAPAIGVASLLVAKHRVAVRVVLDGSALPVAVACGHPGAGAGTPALPSRTDAPPYGGQVVPLHRVAYARSGDKGNAANIGVIARTPDLLPLIREQVTPERVRAFFAHYLGGQV
ncbi:MAG: hypothetical protein QOF36_1789, partial [Microbacteriaceae bacterium]|nr:hypothetical protein [Microbacteriaceae bacterium]